MVSCKNICCNTNPAPGNATLCGRRVSEVKMSCQVSPNPTAGVLTRKFGHRHTRRREHCVKTGTLTRKLTQREDSHAKMEAETGLMLPPAWAAWGYQRWKRQAPSRLFRESGPANAFISDCGRTKPQECGSLIPQP